MFPLIQQICTVVQQIILLHMEIQIAASLLERLLVLATQLLHSITTFLPPQLSNGISLPQIQQRPALHLAMSSIKSKQTQLMTIKINNGSI